VRPLDKLKPVLIVDDFQTMTVIMSRIVQELGYDNIDTAHSGAEALHKMKSKEFGLVICELEMQPMNGLELAFLIRQNRATRKAVIIVTTANREVLGRALSTGQFKLIDAYLMKPFTANQLSTRLKDVSGRIRDPKQYRRLLSSPQQVLDF
jgi:two-component system chemotaxis response regulator CheY